MRQVPFLFMKREYCNTLCIAAVQPRKLVGRAMHEISRPERFQSLKFESSGRYIGK